MGDAVVAGGGVVGAAGAEVVELRAAEGELGVGRGEGEVDA
jgi:hypothetical protein